MLAVSDQSSIGSFGYNQYEFKIKQSDISILIEHPIIYLKFISIQNVHKSTFIINGKLCEDP